MHYYYLRTLYKDRCVYTMAIDKHHTTGDRHRFQSSRRQKSRGLTRRSIYHPMRRDAPPEITCNNIQCRCYSSSHPTRQCLLANHVQSRDPLHALVARRTLQITPCRVWQRSIYRICSLKLPHSLRAGEWGLFSTRGLQHSRVWVMM